MKETKRFKDQRDVADKIAGHEPHVSATRASVSCCNCTKQWARAAVAL